MLQAGPRARIPQNLGGSATCRRPLLRALLRKKATLPRQKRASGTTYASWISKTGKQNKKEQFWQFGSGFFPPRPKYNKSERVFIRLPVTNITLGIGIGSSAAPEGPISAISDANCRSAACDTPGKLDWIVGTDGYESKLDHWIIGLGKLDHWYESKLYHQTACSPLVP